MQGFLEKVKEIAEQVSVREGCTLYDIEFLGAQQGRVLRVYIDKNETGGASIDDCSKVSRGLNEVLDTDESIIPGGEYNLEVSTPGLERVLKERWHFERALQTQISVKTFAPLLDFNPEVPTLDKAKQIVGALDAIEEKGLRLKWTDPTHVEQSVFVPFEQITKSHTVFDFSEIMKPPGEKPKGPKKKLKNIKD